jgi:hypothetical protein
MLYNVTRHLTLHQDNNEQWTERTGHAVCVTNLGDKYDDLLDRCGMPDNGCVRAQPRHVISEESWQNLSKTVFVTPAAAYSSWYHFRTGLGTRSTALTKRQDLQHQHQ